MIPYLTTEFYVPVHFFSSFLCLSYECFILCCITHQNDKQTSHLNFNGYLLQYGKGLYLESLAVELVVLAIWKKALEISNSWLASLTGNELPESSSSNESISSINMELSQTSEPKIDFSDPPSVSMWAKHEFIVAVDRAEKLSCRIQNMDGRISLCF